MVSLARRNLLHGWTRVALSTFGVALTVLFLLTIIGLYNGINAMMERIVLGTGADLWITQAGTSGSLHSPSILSLRLLSQLKRVDGVADATPLVRTAVVYPAKAKNVLLVLNGYDTRGRLGAPWRVTKGKAVPAAGEVIIDESFARSQGLVVGDSMTLGSRRFVIAGLAAQTNIMIGYVVFLRYTDAALFLLPGMANDFLVKVDDPARVNEVREAIIEGVPGVAVKTGPEVVKVYRDEVLGSFSSVVLVLTAMALVAGVVVIGLHVYMLTLEKSREYGIVKAIGATSFYLYRVVLAQTALISVLGFGVGTLVAFPLIRFIQGFIPEFIVTLTPGIVAAVFALFVLTGGFASLIPARRIALIDPAVAFRG